MKGVEAQGAVFTCDCIEGGWNSGYTIHVLLEGEGVELDLEQCHINTVVTPDYTSAENGGGSLGTVILRIML